MTEPRTTQTTEHPVTGQPVSIPATSGKPPKLSLEELSTLSGVNAASRTGEEARALAESVDQGDGLTKSLLLGETHDEQNAQCVRHLHPNFANNESHGWLYYNGQRWGNDDAESKLDRAIVDTMLKRIGAALGEGTDEKGKLYHEDIVKQCKPTAKNVRDAKYILGSLVTIPAKEFDKSPDLLTCQNGVIDLRTGELHPHSPEYLLSHCVNAEYDPAVDYSRWSNWLTDAVGEAIADWLQMAVGYSLTGHTKEEILFYLYGPPRSGKGTFTETLFELMGSPLAKEVEFSTFTAAREGDNQNFDLAPLKPCRIVFASESKSYERFDEAKIKRITGGNEVFCAFKHHSHFNYRPQFKIWLSSNQPINADPDDDAVWGRLRLVEFPNSHLGKEDTGLKERMKSPATLASALTWAVKGAQRWYALGGKPLPETDTAAKAKAGQRGELDHVQTWLEDRNPFQITSSVPSDKLYESYVTWCKVNGVEPKKAKGLGSSLKRKGYSPYRTATERGFSRLPDLDL